MPICDLCNQEMKTAGCNCKWDEFPDEYDDEDEVEDEPDGIAPLLPLRSTQPLPRSAFTPFDVAVVPLRGRYQGAISRLAAWSLSTGRSCDRDVSALFLDVLERRRGDKGLRVTRAQINQAIGCDVPNAASMLGTLLPERWIDQAWRVIVWLGEAGELHPASDPVSALLEPLRCGWGLDVNGARLPEGQDVDFPCQCYLPHDPACPQGMAQFIVGHDPTSHGPFIVHALLLLRSDDPPISTFAPLTKLARRLRADDSVWALHVDELSYVGRVYAHGAEPELWLYVHRETFNLGYEALALDEAGQPWVPKVDRRRKVGFRWVRAYPSAALHRCGATRSQIGAA